jgi:Histidine phosphatase superfamily (branch 1)
MTPEFQRIPGETHLFLVRHGETDFNRQYIVQGRGVDVPLNDLGGGRHRVRRDTRTGRPGRDVVGDP